MAKAITTGRTSTAIFAAIALLLTVSLSLSLSLSLGSDALAASKSPGPDDHLFSVPSGSMMPTLQVGDLIIVDEQPRDFMPLRTGDIVVFHGPAADVVCGSPQSNLLDRIIGLPGETIQSKGNNVYLNNKLLAEPWLPAGTQLGRAIPKQLIPPRRYFMMGDNRSISCDSRYWGTVPASGIIGKVTLICPSNSSEECKAVAQ